MTSIGIGQFKSRTASSSPSKKADSQKTPAKTPRFHARPHELPIQNLESKGKLLSDLEDKNTSSETEGQLAVDVRHKEDEMLVICPIAGVEKSEIRVSLQDDVLTIRGERQPVEGLGLHTPIVSELFWGTFSRSIILPDHIDRKGIKARVQNHLLLITIPKTEDYRARVIHVNA